MTNSLRQLEFCHSPGRLFGALPCAYEAAGQRVRGNGLDAGPVGSVRDPDV